MSVWLWDAQDPGDFSGLSADQDQARLAAEEYLRSGEASFARVELTRIRLGDSRQEPICQRVGVGWKATRTADGVIWSPFAPASRSGNLAIPVPPSGDFTMPQVASAPGQRTAAGRSTNPESRRLMDNDLRKRLLAIGILLEVPEDISDILESELYALRDKFQVQALTNR